MNFFRVGIVLCLCCSGRQEILVSCVQSREDRLGATEWASSLERPSSRIFVDLVFASSLLPHSHSLMLDNKTATQYTNDTVRF
ncbi:hypothetical protein BGY98DRAFT_999849 [Russula aff. rugulosa BPL654]|nr:hypothetical protein BGY98DRAFT_999849 [Russula aff. rugulosa BPL654]